MGDRGDDASRVGSTRRVSDALRHESTGSLLDRLRGVELWLFVDVHRLVLTGLISVAVFLTVVFAVVLSPPSVMAYLVEGTALAKGYVELQTINVTVITIVLAINQLVLTPELGSLGDQRSRLDDALSSRMDAAKFADVPTMPTDPDQYLQTLVGATQDRVSRLREAVADSDDPALRREVDRYAEDVIDEAERVAAGLEDQQFGTIELLGAAMHFTTAEEIHGIRDLHERYADALTEGQAQAFEDVLDLLSLYTVAREYFRSHYVQWEFINFSRAILYVGLPAIVVAHLTVGFVDANAFPGTLFGLPALFLYEALAFTVVLVPVVVVISYAARLSTLAKASIFVSPFSPERRGGHWEE